MLNPPDDVTKLNPKAPEFVPQINELITLDLSKCTEIKTPPSVIALCANSEPIQPALYSNDRSQARVLDTSDEPAFMSRNITVDDLLCPPDEVLLIVHDVALDFQCSLENEDDTYRLAQLLTYDLLSDDDLSVKLARSLCVKVNILNKGYDRMSHSKPCVNFTIDFNLNDLSLSQQLRIANSFITRCVYGMC